jgi:hypothetical protein
MWAGHVTFVQEIRNAYKKPLLVRKRLLKLIFREKENSMILARLI